mmetsp:Transcript_57220/g.65539  ORF Transcript_57220/g.65539 Transcript_57220/m.65539 type:complete len:601 (-) Transcript_57220:1142-2944(-)
MTDILAKATCSIAEALNIKSESTKKASTIAAGVVAAGLVIKVLKPRIWRRKSNRAAFDYDVVIVGGSVAGPTMAKALSDQGKKVLVVERALFEKPDRIVGELLQPGGINALTEIGMENCAVSIGSTCTGYMVVDDKGQHVSLPFRQGCLGYSFHFGDFVNNLRRFVWNNCKGTVTMVEGTVTDVLTDGAGSSERAYGIRYLQASPYTVPERPFDHPLGDATTNPAAMPQSTSDERAALTATAPLVIMCDGGNSKFKSKLNHYSPAKNYHSNFVGIILCGITLPEETRGHVFFGKTGPILCYRLDPNEVRFLVDYNKPQLPGLEETSKWLIDEVSPRLPENIRAEFIRVSSNTKNLRSMAVARYPQLFPVLKGLVGIGDHANQRHPLTGGGMTVAFRDVTRLRAALANIPALTGNETPEQLAQIEDSIQDAIHLYTRNRFLHSSCINILSWALYAVFGSVEMRAACFDYFLLGGDCVSGPMALLSGLEPSPLKLVWHYTKVMVNGAWNMMAKTGSYTGTKPTSMGAVVNVATFFVNPFRLYAALSLLTEATMVFTPLAWMEFVSLWRYLDSTSCIARGARDARCWALRTFFNAKSAKPVGL